MAELKNMKYEHFCREYIRTGGNGTEAYRRVSERFPGKPLTNPKSAGIIACMLRKKPAIKRREQELRDAMAKKSDITIEKVLTDIETAMQIAKVQTKPNEIVNAAMAQAKLVGLLRDRVETGEVGDFEKAQSISEILEQVAEEAGPEAALVLSKALGIAESVPETVPEPVEEDSALAQAIPPTDAVN